MKNEEKDDDTIFSLSEQEYEELRTQAYDNAKKRHTWRQKGIYLVCKTCPYEHAFSIGVNKRLTGVKDNGEPILEDVGK